MLSQEATEEKPNEKTVATKLLELRELAGCTVTIEPLGCQGEIVVQILNQGGEHVLGLKGNQGSMQEAVEGFF